ncbi:hypothetical protein KSP39_PZI003175 [Platanthera zijinensis]|uniref:CTLH domain-containing protein n=1 Tax=Platanthera zijinensis TaxID=2320716 RepID=A0AAP0BW18_9ASPA
MFMGRVDDQEPPSKRVKAIPPGHQGLSNNNPSHSNHIDPLGGQMDGSLMPQGIKDVIGSKGIIKKSEFIRIISKALYSLGYERSGAILEEESGIPLHIPMVDSFRKHVLNGDWDGSLSTLNKINVSDEVLKFASFLILEQKFFEYLAKDRVLDAVYTLRNGISPLNIKSKRVHELSVCIIRPSLRLSLGSINQTSNSRMNLLKELQKVLPPTLMIPEGRLEHLVEQALNVQREACYFHNALDTCLTLYTDHHCRKDQIPSQTTQILQGHGDEVWFVQFSNNGNFLASSSRDNSAIIWEVHEDGVLSLKHTLTGHQNPVLMISWSPDDSQLLTCGFEEVVRRWDVSTGKCCHVYEKLGVGLISCGWFPDGKRFFSGITDRSICMWDLDGEEIESWEGQRMIKTSDLAITGDGNQIISLCKESSILVLDRESKVEKTIEEKHTITSFSLSKDDKFLLVNLVNQEIHLWEINGHPRLVTRYKGHKRSRFVIRSCFGGFEQSYVASGSEDSQVYIWHRGTGNLIAALPGHAGAVNCVSWNPVIPQMLASASDDHNIRIWGGSMVNCNHQEACSNGVRHLNGNSK